VKKITSGASRATNEIFAEENYTFGKVDGKKPSTVVS